MPYLNVFVVQRIRPSERHCETPGCFALVHRYSPTLPRSERDAVLNAVAVQPVGDPVAIEAPQRWPRGARHHELSTGEMHPPAQDRHCFEKYRCAHLISPTDTR